MKAVNITLIFNGQTEAAFTFYKSAFGGDFIHIQKMKDMPGEHNFTPEEGEKVLHVALPVANAILMGMDIPQSRPQTIPGTNFMVTLETGSEEETVTLFKSLSEGGVVMMPPGHQFWGAYFAMVTDKFGIQWQLSYVNQHQ